MHKTIGILGGMSPESTVTYYQHITRTYTARGYRRPVQEVVKLEAGDGASLGG